MISKHRLDKIQPLQGIPPITPIPPAWQELLTQSALPLSLLMQKEAKSPLCIVQNLWLVMVAVISLVHIRGWSIAELG